jgi:hypothetical protein
MHRVFRRRWSFFRWLCLGLLLLILIRIWGRSPPRNTVPLPVGLVRVLEVEPGAILHVEPVHAAQAERYRVRLIGLPHRELPAATSWLRDTYLGKELRVALDKRRIDADGVYLAYLYAGNTFVNAELIRRNLADYEPYLGDASPPAKLMKEAEKQSLLPP